MDAALELKPADDVRQALWARYVERALFNRYDLNLAARAATCFLPDEDGADNARQMYQEVVDTIAQFTKRVERLTTFTSSQWVKFDEVNTVEAERADMIRRRQEAGQEDNGPTQAASRSGSPTGDNSDTSDYTAWQAAQDGDNTWPPPPSPPPKPQPRTTPAGREPKVGDMPPIELETIPPSSTPARSTRPRTPAPNSQPTALVRPVNTPRPAPCTQRVEGPLIIDDDGIYADASEEGTDINLAPDGLCISGCDEHPSFHGRQEMARLLRASSTPEHLITAEAVDAALSHRGPAP